MPRNIPGMSSIGAGNLQRGAVSCFLFDGYVERTLELECLSGIPILTSDVVFSLKFIFLQCRVDFHDDYW